MKTAGIVLLVVGVICFIFAVMPDSVFYALNFGRNFIRFINNWTFMIACFTLSAGWAAMVAGKRRLRRSEHY